MTERVWPKSSELLMGGILSPNSRSRPGHLGEGFHLREAVKPAPDPLRRTLLQQQLIAVADDQHNAVAMPECSSSACCEGRRWGLPCDSPLAIGLHQAALAGRLAAGADGGPMSIMAWLYWATPTRGRGGSPAPEIVLTRFWPGKPASASQRVRHPMHAIQGWRGLAQRERDNGPGGWSDRYRAGPSPFQLFQGKRPPQIADLLGSLVQVAGARA